MRIMNIILNQYNMNLKTQLRTKQLESEEATKILKRDYENQVIFLIVFNFNEMLMVYLNV